MVGRISTQSPYSLGQDRIMWGTECDEYIRIFEYSNIFDPNIYSDIRSYHFLDTNIFGYSFLSIFRMQTDSDNVFVENFWILHFAYGYFVDNNDQKCYFDCKSIKLVQAQSRV